MHSRGLEQIRSVRLVFLVDTTSPATDSACTAWKVTKSIKKPEQSIFRSACSDGLPHDGEAGKSC